MKRSALFGIITCLSLAIGAGVTLGEIQKPLNAHAVVDPNAFSKSWDFGGSSANTGETDWTISGNTASSGYQLVPATVGTAAVFTLNSDIFTDATQPTTDITISISVATYGSGDSPTNKNSTISFKGAEDSSTWASTTWSGEYPTSKAYQTLTTTLKLETTPTKIHKLIGSFNVNSGVKQFRLKNITVSCTTAAQEFGTLSTIEAKKSSLFVDTYMAGSQFSTTGLTALATSTTAVTKTIEAANLTFFIGSTDITSGHNFTSAEVGSLDITVKYTLDSVTAADTVTLLIQDLHHIVLDTSKTQMTFAKGETFSGSKVTGTAYGAENETTAATSNITNASLSFYKDSAKTASLTDYVFIASDAGTCTVYSFFTLSATGTEKYASYDLTITIDASYTNTFGTNNGFPSTATTADIGENGYTKLATFGSNRLTLAVSGTATTKTRVISAGTNGQQIGTSDYSANSIILKTGIISTSSSEVKITKAKISVQGASSTSSGTIAPSFAGIGDKTYSGNGSTELEFVPTQPVFGSVSFTFSNIVKGVYIQKIQIFSETDSTDKGLAYAFAHDVELANGCNATSYSSLITAYDTLSAGAKDIANAIVIDDLANGATTETADATIGRCTVAQKLAAMKDRAEAGSSLSLSDGKEDSSLALTIGVIGTFLILATGMGFVLFKKKRA